MKQSRYFLKTSKTTSSDEVSKNARLLERAGFIYKNSAGIYSYLPLGFRVLEKISRIIREEMNAIDSQEMFMPALHDKHYLKATGRWDVDVVFKVMDSKDSEPSFNISWTHEEIIAEIASRFVSSYKDLPFSIYQIQTKFRNEPRAKSGLLRGREFIMKDMYSFHDSEASLWDYYERVKESYLKVFTRCGLQAYCTLAAGGDFTVSNTHEFQVISEVGEDVIRYCPACLYSENLEVVSLQEGENCPKCGNASIQEAKSIEVGNIFPLGTKYSSAFNLKYQDNTGESRLVVMGSYGIGVGRVMGTVVEVMADENSLNWPKSIAPFQIHLLTISPKNNPELIKVAEEVYQSLEKSGFEVFYDDRQDVSAGEKFADSDLLGLPYRLVLSSKTMDQNSLEFKDRATQNTALLKLTSFIDELKKLTK